MPLIVAATAEQAQEFARRLLDTAETPAEVVTDTSTDGVIAFRVSEELAAAAGFSETGDDIDPDTGGDIDPGGAGTGGADTGTGADELPPVPAGNDSREEWAAFLSDPRVGIAFPADAGRNELRALWAADPRNI